MSNNSWIYYEILIMILEKCSVYLQMIVYHNKSNVYVVIQSMVAGVSLSSFATDFIFTFLWSEK